jgi:hypothetical protein
LYGHRQQQRQYSDEEDDESEEKGGHSKNAAGRSYLSEGIGKGRENNARKVVVLFLLSLHMCQ